MKYEERVWHRLALAIGGHTVAELKAKMGVSEFRNWIEFISLEGLPVQRNDFALSHIAYLIAQTNSKKRLRLKDFLFAWEEDKEQEPVENPKLKEKMLATFGQEH